MIKAIIFDYGWTLMDHDNDELYPEVSEILNTLLQRGLKLALVSRVRDEEKRKQEFERLDLKKWFEIMVTLPSNENKDFAPILQQLNVVSAECMVVGDRIKSEITMGNKIGAVTVWIPRGKFAQELPEIDIEQPSYTIHSLTELLPIITEI